ncbi:NADPH-dependent FMN reductase family protein [Romboutsia weinsteinii]|uniref:hypothetical protein n=1 Tax=Romboutsia weinsteinii TaxID=2020949 RepID=UPI0013146188|nr:hypothetical protein [Romboutsia weinsteinii]
MEDYLNRTGKIFKYTPEAEIEIAVKYLESMMRFFGVKDIEKVVIEVHNKEVLIKCTRV